MTGRKKYTKEEIKEHKLAYQRIYRQNPEVRAKNNAYGREYGKRPELKEKRKIWSKNYRDKPENKIKKKIIDKEYHKIYNQKPEVKLYYRTLNRLRHRKNKELGLCVNCSNKPEIGRIRCQKHLDCQKKWYQRNRKERRLYNRKWSEDNPELKRKQDKESSVRHRETRLKGKRRYYHNNKNKAKAEYMARKIDIKDKVCSVCKSSNKLIRHHPDYSKPLDIVVLCVKCHNRLHNTKND